jgi:MFS transporter, SP family, galactose:H+ symporter
MLKKRSDFFVLFLTLCAGLGGILYGYDIGVISGALVYIRKTIPLTTVEAEVIVGGVLFGSLLGVLISGSLADLFGRKKMILSACVIFILGVFTILIAKSFVGLFFSRILLGIAVGVLSVTVPLYLSEIVPANVRGRSVSSFQIFLTLGILLAYLVDYFFTASGNWHAMFLIILIPTVLLLMSMLFAPETPRWLLAKNKTEEARKVLLKVQGAKALDSEIDSIKQSLHGTKVAWSYLFQRHLWLPLSIAILVAVCNQLTGVNIILQYAPLFFHAANIHMQSLSMLATVGVGAIQVIFTLLSIAFIDVIGRKRLLIIGTAGLVIVDLLIAFGFSWLKVYSFHTSLIVIGLFFYIAFYAIGPGVVVWLVISELLPTKVRGKAIALSLFINGLVGTVLSSSFLSIIHSIGMADTYFAFAFFTLIYFLVAKYALLETKGRTLEEIQEHYEKHAILGVEAEL